ncbi:MAG: hypothetical protein AAGD25_30835 [Cyanobacteria bacterium P01_F01_bin.150]
MFATQRLNRSRADYSIAHAAFPQGNLYLWLRDELGVVYSDEDYRLPKKRVERTAYAQQIGQDGMILLERLWQADTLPSLRTLEAVENLREYWAYQYVVDNGMVKLRAIEDMPSPAERLSSPYEHDARVVPTLPT